MDKEKLTLIKFNDRWHAVDEYDKEGIIDSMYVQDMQIVPEDMVKKYNIKENDKKEDLIKKYGEEFEDDLSDCEYAETYADNYIVLDSIDENSMYVDKDSYEFYRGSKILGWYELGEYEKYYNFWNGSNWKMIEIEDIKEVEAELIDVVQYDTGNRRLYKLEDGTKFTVNNSFYQGSIDYVEEDIDFGNLEKNIETKKQKKKIVSPNI